MDAKEVVKRGYELFGKGDMETFFTEVVHDEITWIFPGDKHPMSGTHKGKEAMMKTMSLIPQHWNNFSVTPEFMIAEGNKVFAKCKATAVALHLANTLFPSAIINSGVTEKLFQCCGISDIVFIIASFPL